MIVVLSVMNGFQSQIKDKILDVNSHITVSNLTGGLDSDAIKAYREVSDKIKKLNRVTSVNAYIQGQGLFRFKRNIGPIMIRGVGSKDDIPSDIVRFIIENRAGFCNEKGIYIGKEMSFRYGIERGDIIDLIVPQGRITAITGIMPGIERYKVLGFFKTGYYEFDTKLILMSLTDAQRLYSVGDVAYEIGIKIDDIYRMDRVSSDIQKTIGFEYRTHTAEENNHNLFYALKLEKLIMTVILFLVIVSAGFTIMGTIVMVVMEKRRAIGILKSIGAKPGSIMSIFVLEGFFIGVIGTFMGVILGLATSLNFEAIIVWIENTINSIMTYIYELFMLGDFYRISIVPTNVYYIDTLPSEVKTEFVVFIAAAAIFLSTFAAIVPAWQASRQRPVETIRYE
ncbi:MAG: FtsX-like permease family protein [Leptospirales bacterium]|nr:FtsX-like permease family protein [Leptospirales bacterium]